MTTGVTVVWSHNMHLDTLGVRPSDISSMHFLTLRVWVIGDMLAGIYTSASKPGQQEMAEHFKALHSLCVCVVMVWRKCLTGRIIASAM